jgi:hypothetical protein
MKFAIRPPLPGESYMLAKVATVIGAMVVFWVLGLAIGIAIFFGGFMIIKPPTDAEPQIVAIVALNLTLLACPFGMAALGGILALCLVNQSPKE